MLLKKKDQRSREAQEQKSLYPVLHVADSLKEYQKELVKKEVASLWELGQVGDSFSDVLREGDQFQAKLQELGESFSSISQTAEQFGQVREEIGRSVDEARNQMGDLGQVSGQVQKSFDAMAETFTQLESAIRGIQQSMGKIASIAEQTNILAINASIEAARAGQEGRGFAVVATQVKTLAEEIKALTGEVDSGVSDVEGRAGELSQSISMAEQTLAQSTAIVGATEGSFEKINAAAEGAVAVQGGIAGVIQASQGELEVLCQFFDRIKGRYQEVVKHIDSASRLGTTKSAMFEDMDNMISQIPPLVSDLESGK